MESSSPSPDPPDRELSADETALMKELERSGLPRREFLKIASYTGTGLLGAQLLATREADAQAPAAVTSPIAAAATLSVGLHVNGTLHEIRLDPRTVLLDALRETLGLTGTKKGCDHGQCGACTVIVDGKRVLSCLTLAAQAEGKVIRTVEGLAGEELHPMQEAFIKHDSFQCGYCTPGQLCSAVALLDEAKRGEASFVTADLSKSTPDLSDDEIRERMSGNICRCAAYPQIVAAIREVQSGGQSAQTWGFAPCLAAKEDIQDHETV
ncbi:MAG: 2Fe-2S iron-sulfur cluster binding domain-containing protein [Verrucomicrobiaceae bacterium]|nr:MAG: 2Fe-2S iron-sulfur cluster binding domain-containing protein [Verrucomicrobiaceae bacterium]